VNIEGEIDNRSKREERGRRTWLAAVRDSNEERHPRANNMEYWHLKIVVRRLEAVISAPPVGLDLRLPNLDLDLKEHPF
jgi:hypothetical protein